MALTRDLLRFSKLFPSINFTEISNEGSLKRFPFVTSVRTGKHYNPKYAWLRGKKYIPRILPNTKEAERKTIKMLKDSGIFPRYWKPRNLTVTSVGEIIEPYKPDVNDGKVSVLEGAKSLVTDTKSKVSNINTMRKLKNYEPNFKPEIFVQEAQDIYIKAHTVLMNKSAEELSQYATEKAITEMRDGLKNTTVRWKFIESLEPPRVVQTKIQDMISPTNLFAQVTVRFHTKQSLAIYDRFGRLMYGSEILAKDVLEYVVFEKHINNVNGAWRLHGKIIPEWREPDARPARTYRVHNEEDEKEESDDSLDDFPEREYAETSDVVQPATQA